jgi:hypothetical protein
MMKEDSDLLKGWTFEIDEISVNVYRIRGIDESGRSVEKTGTDPDMLLTQCKADALQISCANQRRKQSG